jgi:hypothetical protein
MNKAIEKDLRRIAVNYSAGNTSDQALVVQLQQLLDAAKNVAERDAKE